MLSRMADPLRLRDPDIAIRAIEMFIFEHANYHHGAIIDLDGDLDSVLLLTLAVRALGADRVHALLFTHERHGTHHVEDALSWAKSLGVDPIQVAIGERYQFETLSRLQIADSPIAWGNFLTRMKMVWAYTVANDEHRLFLGKLNRSRWLTGHFTKYGDGAADLFPLGNLFRSQTLQLAKHLQLPVSILGEPPSAGFWEGQTDQKELGTSYDTLDHILYHLVDRSHSPQETAERLGVNEHLVYDIITRLEISEHKRQSPLMAEIEGLYEV
jgi:NAD+ synthase